MIKDNLKNASKYYSLSPRMELAFKFLENNNLNNFKLGQHEIDGDNIYMNIQEYETKISDNLEAHRKYIDIQYMIKGEEKMGVCSLDNLIPTCEYDEEKDVIFYKGECDFELVKENDFIVFYPEDAHLPCQVVEAPKMVKKVVVKVLV